MIAHTTWRDLFYKLAEAHPDCLMLNFTVKVGRTLQSRKDEKQGSSGVSGARSESEEQRLSLLRVTLTVSVGHTHLGGLRLGICANRPQADLIWLPSFRHQGPGDL